VRRLYGRLCDATSTRLRHPPAAGGIVGATRRAARSAPWRRRARAPWRR